MTLSFSFNEGFIEFLLIKRNEKKVSVRRYGELLLSLASCYRGSNEFDIKASGHFYLHELN
jgi:hypothetical protein